MPVTVKVIADVPAPRVLGETEVSVGAAGALIVKFAEDWPPPGVELLTMTETVPLVLKSLAAIGIVNCEELTNVA